MQHAWEAVGLLLAVIVHFALSGLFIWGIIHLIRRKKKKRREGRREKREYTPRWRSSYYRRPYQTAQAQPVQSAPSAEKDKWMGMRNMVGGKFKEARIGGYQAVYCFDYYPKSKYPALNGIDAKHREAILKFKDGYYKQAAYLLGDFLKGNFWKNERPNWTLCVIPASTKERHERRYKTFCEKVCAETGVQNGYPLLWPSSDRPDSRLQKEDNTVRSVGCDGTGIRGRKIILFDDCATRGVSFKQTADILKACGATWVIGFFLGKSVFIE